LDILIKNCQGLVLIPLEKAIHLHLLPKLYLHPPNDSERAILALPICSGNLELFNPCQSSKDSSVSVTSPMAASIINQFSSFDCTIFHRQCDLKQEALSIKHQRLTDALSTLSYTLPPNLQLSLKLAGDFLLAILLAIHPAFGMLWFFPS